MTVEQILLIRHGQTIWNAEKRWQGSMNIPLNEEGRAQAQALARYLVAMQPIVTALYSSDLLRAWETAEILGHGLNLVPQADRRWREVDAGLFEGHTWSEIEAQHPDHVAQYHALGRDFRFPDGESWREVQERVAQAFQELIARENGSTVAIVAHGGTIRSLLVELFPDSTVSAWHLPNTSITVLERSGDRWHVKETAITPHLAN